MPTYQYDCPKDGSFQKQAGREDSEIPCPRCGKTAQRAPFCRDGLPAIFGETVAKVSGRSGPDLFDMALQRAATENKVPR